MRDKELGALTFAVPWDEVDESPSSAPTVTPPGFRKTATNDSFTTKETLSDEEDSVVTEPVESAPMGMARSTEDTERTPEERDLGAGAAAVNESSSRQAESPHEQTDLESKQEWNFSDTAQDEDYPINKKTDEEHVVEPIVDSSDTAQDEDYPINKKTDERHVVEPIVEGESEYEAAMVPQVEEAVFAKKADEQTVVEPAMESEPEYDDVGLSEGEEAPVLDYACETPVRAEPVEEPDSPAYESSEDLESPSFVETEDDDSYMNPALERGEEVNTSQATEDSGDLEAPPTIRRMDEPDWEQCHVVTPLPLPRDEAVVQPSASEMAYEEEVADWEQGHVVTPVPEPTDEEVLQPSASEMAYEEEVESEEDVNSEAAVAAGFVAGGGLAAAAASAAMISRTSTMDSDLPDDELEDMAAGTMKSLDPDDEAGTAAVLSPPAPVPRTEEAASRMDYASSPEVDQEPQDSSTDVEMGRTSDEEDASEMKTSDSQEDDRLATAALAAAAIPTSALLASKFFGSRRGSSRSVQFSDDLEAKQNDETDDQDLRESPESSNASDTDLYAPPDETGDDFFMSSESEQRPIDLSTDFSKAAVAGAAVQPMTNTEARPPETHTDSYYIADDGSLVSTKRVDPQPELEMKLLDRLAALEPPLSQPPLDRSAELEEEKEEEVKKTPWYFSRTCIIITILILLVGTLIAVIVPLTTGGDDGGGGGTVSSGVGGGSVSSGDDDGSVISGDDDGNTTDGVGDGVGDGGTVPPMPSREDQIRSLVLGITDQSVLEDSSTPQAAALDWIVNEDSLSSVGSPPNEGEEESLLQRYSVAVLYYATGGDTWVAKSGWLDPLTSECGNSTWEHLLCEDGVIVEFNTGSSSNGMSGVLPSELNALTGLRRLSMFRNALSGITDGFGPPSLNSIDLGSNNIAGEIPTSIYEMTLLESLYLDNNKFVGTISPQISDLTRMKTLLLASNNLNGTLTTELQSLTDLEFLGLDRTSLEGNFGTIVDGLLKLEFISFRDSSVTGTIPPAIGDYTFLRTLDLGRTSLSNTIPPEIGNLVNLKNLLLDGASLSGRIPAEIGSLESLERLFLQRNQFEGPSPETICALPLLTDFRQDCANTCSCCFDCFT